MARGLGVTGTWAPPAERGPGDRVHVGLVVGGVVLACIAMAGCFEEPPVGSLLPTWLDGPSDPHADPTGAGHSVAGSVTSPLAEVAIPDGPLEPTAQIIDNPGQSPSDAGAAAVTSDPGTEFTFTLTVSGEGQTDPLPGSSPYPARTTVVLDAVPNGGSWFAGWGGDVQGEDTTIVIVMDGDKSVTAEFRPFATEAGPRFHLPWAVGCTHTIGQGNNGSFSHADLFAWDVTMPIGTPVVAAGAGRIVDVREADLPDDPMQMESVPLANLVTIDHGGGLKSLYGHLDYEGVAVVPGQWVARGQVIGFSGNTGFSTAPHLHYEVTDVFGESVSTCFHEVNRADGIAVNGEVLTSRNTLDLELLADYAPSTLPPDAFSINDLELTGETSPAFFYETNTDYLLTGRVLDGRRRVCPAVVDPSSLETVFCELTAVEEDGTFTILFRFAPDMVGRFWFGVISGDGGVEGIAPRSILISPRVNPADRPVAMVDPPDDSTIDFQETRRLAGNRSFSPSEHELTYQWIQVTGPPATIAGPTAAETDFTLEYGEGIDRVSFQLVVFDGELHSLPAQVDFHLPGVVVVNDGNPAN